MYTYICAERVVPRGVFMLVHIGQCTSFVRQDNIVVWINAPGHVVENHGRTNREEVSKSLAKVSHRERIYVDASNLSQESDVQQTRSLHIQKVCAVN